MSTQSIKEDAKKLIDTLPDICSWDDLMQEIYVRQMIESGLRDSREGNTQPVEEIRKEFGLPS